MLRNSAESARNTKRRRGADKLRRGLDLDKLYGGGGADRLIFKSVAESTVASPGQDIIYNFGLDGGDRMMFPSSMKTITPRDSTETSFAMKSARATPLSVSLITEIAKPTSRSDWTMSCICSGATSSTGRIR